MTFLEFTKLMVTNTRNYDQEETLREVFLAFDRNGDGTLAPGELHCCLTWMGMQVARDDLEELCNEFGGEIKFKDFCKTIGKFDFASE